MDCKAHGQLLSSIGCEWIVDAFDCNPDRLRELATLQQLCDEILNDLRLQVVGEPMWHRFPGEGGVTGLYLLSESHLACHTYPEFGLATFNLVCCRDLPEWPYREVFERELGALRCEVIFIPRGVRTEHSANQSGGTLRGSMP